MKKKVLIVDDIKFNIELESKVLKSLMDDLAIDIEIDAAYSVNEAIGMINENDIYDAMIIDMNLPDGTGLDIAKHARKKSEKTQIAALTIYPNRYDQHRAYFDFFLKKPIMPTTFKQNFARLLRI